MTTPYKVTLPGMRMTGRESSTPFIDSTYIRYTTTEKKTILHQMAEDYEVGGVYGLDMYRKVNNKEEDRK